MRYYFLILFVFVQFNFAFADNNNKNNKSENAAVAPNFSEAVHLLSEYIKIPSVTGNEQEAGQFLADFCLANNLHVEVFNDEKDSYNFAASIYPLSLGKPNIILLNHIDVVSAGNHQEWQAPPYSGAVNDSAIVGRGAIDCKGLAVMQLMALLNFNEMKRESNLPFNVTLLSVSGEETGGMKGSQIIIRDYLDFLNPMVVMGEGGSGIRGVLPNKPDEIVYGISIAEKTNIWLELTLKEKVYGHGASPGFSYPNKSMIEALTRLNHKKTKLKFNHANRLMFKNFGSAIGGLRGFVIKHANWAIFNPFVKSFIKKDPLYRSLLTNTVTVTNLNNPPGAPNQIAPQTKAILDCRLLPGTKKKTFIRKVRKVLGEPLISIKILDEGPNCESTNPDLFYQAMEESLYAYHPTENVHVIPMLFPATTDNGFFREAGIPTYGFMPAEVSQQEIKNVHNANESISKEALNDGILIYTIFLKNLEDHFPAEKEIDLEIISTN